ncbi:MAG: hypothetical protein V4482_06645 [Pseudomonadota bacterium]
MLSCNNQTANLKRYGKKIIFGMSLIACSVNSASAMMRASLNHFVPIINSMSRNLTVVPVCMSSNLSHKFLVYSTELKELNKLPATIDFRTKQASHLRGIGLEILSELSIKTSDSIEDINEKTHILRPFLDSQCLCSVMDKKDIISLCNDSILNYCINPQVHSVHTAAFLKVIICYPFSLDLRVGYPCLEKSLELLEKCSDKESEALIKLLIAQSKENHGLSLMGNEVGIC